MPLSSRILSAAAVVGPLAPSQRTLALIWGAFLRVMTFSVAAGMSTSQSSVSTCSLVVASALGEPASWRRSRTQRARSGTSRPLGFTRPPDLSDTAITTAPSLAIRSADTDPTLPNPCTTTRAPLGDRPSFASASRVTNMHPRPVASRRPSDPPISTGLPVTTAVTVWRLCMEYVSMIHAITRSFVFTSGAAERNVHDGALPRHPRREGLHLVQRDVQVEADAALARSPRRVVQHPVPGVDLDLAVVPHDGDRDDDLLFRVPQDPVEPGIEVQEAGGVIEALHHRLERVLLGEEGVFFRPDGGRLQGGLGRSLDGGVAHGLVVTVRCKTPASARSTASPFNSQTTSSTATNGSRMSRGQRCRS